MNLPMMSSFIPAAPEIFLLTMVCIIMLIDLWLKPAHRGVTYGLSQATLIVLAIITWQVHPAERIIAFDNEFVLDNLATLLKLFMYLMVFGVFLYGRCYVKTRDMMRGEFHLLVLLSLLGAMVMVSAASMVSLYLGLELMALPTYAMVAMHRSSKTGPESAMKYFVMGAIASGMLLYGMSLFYGVCGSLELAQMSHYLVHNSGHAPVLYLGLVFFIVGIAFKFGLVPFHMWIPDVYQGAPTVVTALLGTMPKLAAFGLLFRLVLEPLPHLQWEWQQVFYVLAVLSLILGNLLAVVQTNIKRMLAYSTIAQMGFMFLGIAMGDQQGVSAALFYGVTYAVTALGAFGVLMLLSRQGFEAEQLEDLAGLNQRHRWVAIMMMLLMFSMAGIPPLVGFSAKFMILEGLIQHQQYYLAIMALLFSVIGAYYYIRVIRVMYFDAPKTTTEVEMGMMRLGAISINGLAVLVLGILPSALLAYCQLAIVLPS